MNIAKPKRIHIIGSVGSGKTTLARILSAQLNIPHYELDNVVWERSADGDIRRSEEERDECLSCIINTENWIVEGVHHTWISPSLQNADVILFLDTRLSIRRVRIVKRFLLQKIGLETANYKPTLKIFQDLYHYNTVFENKSKPEIFELIRPYESKLIILKSNREIKNYFH